MNKIAMTVALVVAAQMTVTAKDFVVGEKTGAAIQTAVDAAAKAGGGRVVVPAGEYPTGSIRLRSHVDLHLEKGAHLLGATNSAAYFSFPDEVCSFHPEDSTRVFVYAWDETDIAITGEGVIDGRGHSFFDTTKRMWGHFFPKPPCERPRMVQFVRCRGIRLEGVTFLNSPCWTMLIRLCEDISATGITVQADDRIINSDGIDFDGCRKVRVTKSTFSTGDDCIVTRAIREPDGKKVVCEDVLVTDCSLKSACQCVRMGCPSDDEIRNVTFRNITLHGRIGVNFDYPARYLRPGNSGLMDIHDVLFENITGDLGYGPFVIAVEPGVRIRGVRNVTFRNVNVGCKKLAKGFVGNVHSKIENVRFENVTIAGERRPDGVVAADCTNAGPLVREGGSSWETKKAKKKAT